MPRPLLVGVILLQGGWKVMAWCVASILCIMHSQWIFSCNFVTLVCINALCSSYSIRQGSYLMSESDHIELEMSEQFIILTCYVFRLALDGARLELIFSQTCGISPIRWLCHRVCFPGERWGLIFTKFMVFFCPSPSYMCMCEHVLCGGWSRCCALCVELYFR